MADNKSTIEDTHFQVYIDPKHKNQEKHTYKEYLTLMSNSGVHMLYDSFSLDDIYFLSMKTPNSLVISKRQLREVHKLIGCGLTFKDKDTLIICGGIHKETEIETNACYEYSISTNEFTRLPDMITPRYSFVIFYQDNTIYVFGGNLEGHLTDKLKKCEYFDYALKKWIAMADLKRYKSGESVINYRNEFWLAGHYIDNNEGYLIERYIKSKNIWEIVNIKFSSRFLRCHFLLSSSDNEVLIRFNGSSICKLNLLDHTLMVIPEFYTENIHAYITLPLDERKMLLMYSYDAKRTGCAL